MQQHLTRATPDLVPATRCLGAACSPAAPPFCSSNVHIVYLFSSNLRQSYHCRYFFKSCALPIHLCITAAPLHNLLQPSTCAPLRNLVHYPSTCATLRNLVHYPSTCALLRNLVQPSTCAPLLQHYAISCTSYSCTLLHLLVLVHLSCTTRTIVHPYSCTAQSRAPRTCVPYCTCSYSCTSHAPLELSCTHTHAPLNLVHPSSPLVVPLKSYQDHRRGWPTIFR